MVEIKYLKQLAVFSLFLVLVGCGGGDDTTDTTVDGGTTGDGSTTSAYGPEEECRFAEDCANANSVTADKAAYWMCNIIDAANSVSRCVCTANDACPGNKLCNPYTGVCYDKSNSCRSDTACKSEEYCDLEENVCKTRKTICESCKEDYECGGESDKCLVFDELTGVKYCGKACSTSTECNSDGGSRFACTNGQCGPARATCCASSYDCQIGQRCDSNFHTCEAYCESDEDCPEAQKCCQNTCVRELECSADCACRNGLICNYVKSECIIPCIGSNPGEDGSCPPGGTLNSAKTKCVPPPCPQGTVCQSDGSCSRGCTTNGDCLITENCQGGVCVSGRCQTNDVCSKGQFCQNGSCITPTQNYCQTGCSAGMSCGGSSSNYCLALDNNPLSTNTYCAINCETAGQADDSKCPKGYVCTSLVNQLGQVVGHACYPMSGSCK